MKISINLLPPEIMVEEQKKAKFYKIQAIGVIFILTIVFLTSLTLALRILQSRNIEMVQKKLTQVEQKVTSLKDTEASLFILKNRLSVISQYLGVPSNQSATYKLFDRLVPSSVVTNAITVAKNGEVIFLGLAPDSASLENLVNNLTTKESNEDKISQVSVESLNRGRDGLFRINFKIKPK